MCMLTQSCPTLWDPMYCSPPGSSAHEIFQARVLEWVAISCFDDLPKPVIKANDRRTQYRVWYSYCSKYDSCCSYKEAQDAGQGSYRSIQFTAQSCLTLGGPMYCSPPGSSAHETFQARILEWVAIPSPGNIPHLGIEHRSPALQVTSLPSKPPGKPKTGVLGIYLELNFGRFLKSGFHFLIFSNIKVFPHRLQCHLVHIHSR